MAVGFESQWVVWHVRPPANTLRGLIPRGPGRLGARRTGRESSRASLTTSRVVWEFAQVLCSTRLVFSPRFDVGKGEEASCGSATPDEAGESPTEARPGGCADDDGQLVAAPASKGRGRMPHGK